MRPFRRRLPGVRSVGRGVAVVAQDFRQPIDRDAVMLVDGEAVVRVHDKERGALAAGLGVDPDALRLRAEIGFELVAQPAAPRPPVGKVAIVEAVEIAFEILARERRPATEAELLRQAMHGNFEHGADHEIFAAEDAEILRQEIAVEAQRGVRLLFLAMRPRVGRERREVHHAVMDLIAPGAGPCVGKGIGGWRRPAEPAHAAILEPRRRADQSCSRSP